MNEFIKIVEKFENDVVVKFDELNVEIDDVIIYDVENNVAAIFSSSLMKNMLIDDPEIKKMNDEIDVVVEKLHDELIKINHVENVEIVNDEITIEINHEFHDELIELNELYDDMKIYF